MARKTNLARCTVAMAATAVVAGTLTGTSSATPSSSAAGRYIVVARSSGDLAALQAKAVKSGAHVVRSIHQLNTMVVEGPAAVRTSLSADSRALEVAADHVESIAPAERRKPNLAAPGLFGARTVAGSTANPATAGGGVHADPAFHYKGLLWDYRRMGLPQGWQTTQGSPAITVGVADTGIDFTHYDLASKVDKVVDFTQTENPPICKTYYGFSDRDLARKYGGPEKGDWNGHGSWIAGNIGAALNGKGTNGIAPNVRLVALKVSQWCGSAYDSELINSFVTAADMNIDVVNISFGGFLDRSNADENRIYRLYERAVDYAKSRGTAIVASAGNNHVEIGYGGRVLSHGSLTTPGTARADFTDLYGLYQVPGGINGVIDVSATGNVVVPSSRNCPPGTIGTAEDANATCKPRSDRHQAAGSGEENQLAYYSNYGSRIDIAGPGGARKFNLPNYDRGGTPGFPYTSSDLTNVYEAFSTTSNWALEIPCFTFTRGSGFPQGQCYTAIQGTSMSAPHVAAAYALVASAHKDLRGNVDRISNRLIRTATDERNYTRALSATDKSPGDLYGDRCVTGYCHLTGARIPDWAAYGAGLVNVARP
jgi:subtilisin family serine protease